MFGRRHVRVLAPCLCLSFNGRLPPMRRSIRLAGRGVMEVLGSFEPSSLNPRRNTSKSCFEPFRSGDKAETCFRFVSALSPLFVEFVAEVDTKRKRSGNMFPLSNNLSQRKCERYDERQTISVKSDSLSKRDRHAEEFQAASLIRTHLGDPAAKVRPHHSACRHCKVR